MVSKDFRRSAIKSLQSQYNIIMRFINKVKQKEQNITFEQLYNATKLNLNNTSDNAISDMHFYITPREYRECDDNITIPIEFCKLHNLERLFLANNKLVSVPEELSKLTNLNMLALNRNKLCTIPTELGVLCKLEYLYLDDNFLNEIPLEYKNLTNLKLLNILYNNPFITYPPEFDMKENLSIYTNNKFN
jgi:Leucine-rich repeat (LRR) protein